MLLPIAGAQLCTNVLLQIDIALLGRFLGNTGASQDGDMLEWSDFRVSAEDEISDTLMDIALVWPVINVSLYRERHTGLSFAKTVPIWFP